MVAGTNRADNPDKIDLLVWTRATFGTSAPHTRKWMDPHDTTALARLITRSAERWGNAYVSVGTYGQAPNAYREGTLQYSRRVPLPRRCFPVDDVTDLATLPLSPTWATETSYRNYQAGYTCDELLTPAEAEALAAGAARLLGADPSGADATQLIRVPGTLNTKAKCAGRPGDPATGQEPEGWRVRLICAEGPRYSRRQLAEAFLTGGLAELNKLRRGVKRVTKAQRTARPGADLLAYTTLPSGEALMSTPRYRAIFANRPQLAKLARGEHVTLPTERGPQDTGSEQVAVLVANLLTVGRSAEQGGPVVPGLGAPLIDEVRAIALFWRETLRPDCDLRAYQADVERLIARYQPPGYDPEPTRGLSGGPRPTLRALPAPRHRGRPAGQRAEQAERLAQHLAALPVDADGVRRTRRAELAQALQTTERMISSYLADLRAAGRLDTRTEARALAVLRVEIKCPPAPAREGGNRPPVEGIGTRETASGAVGSTHPAPGVPPAPAPAPPGGGVCTPPGAHPAPTAPSPTAPTLRALVGDGMDAHGHSLPRVCRYLAANGAADADPVAVKWLYDDELQRRRWAREDAALRRKAESLRPAAARRLLERLARRVRDAQTNGETFLWQRKHAIVAQVIEDRRPAPPVQPLLLPLDLPDQPQQEAPKPMTQTRGAATPTPSTGTAGSPAPARYAGSMAHHVRQVEAAVEAPLARGGVSSLQLWLAECANAHDAVGAALPCPSP